MTSRSGYGLERGTLAPCAETPGCALAGGRQQCCKPLSGLVSRLKDTTPPMPGDAGVTPKSGQIAGRVLPPLFLGGVDFMIRALRGAGQQGLGGIPVDKLSPRVKDVSITVSIGDILVFEKAS